MMTSLKPPKNSPSRLKTRFRSPLLKPRGVRGGRTGRWEGATGPIEGEEGGGVGALAGEEDGLEADGGEELLQATRLHFLRKPWIPHCVLYFV